jgi:hypothetical protein
MPKCRTTQEHSAIRLQYTQLPRWDELEHPINSILYREMRDGEFNNELKIKSKIKLNFKNLLKANFGMPPHLMSTRMRVH